jgi:DNA-binding NarL/FixJ family response regulator
VAIIDDDQIWLEGIREGLASASDFVCRLYANPEIALAKVAAEPPDVVLMDLIMPGMSGIDCTRWLRCRRPRLPIVFLTARAEPKVVFAALAAGAVGFLDKPISPRECSAALQEAIAGGHALSVNAPRWVIDAFRACPEVWDADILSARPETSELVAARRRISEVRVLDLRI